MTRGTIDATNAYLMKKPYRGGWRWHGQIRYKDAGGTWRTTQKALTGEDGGPILTDADTTDDDNKKVQTTRNIRAARRALDAWRAEIGGMPIGGRSTVADYMRADLDGRAGSVQGSTMRKYRDYARLVARSPIGGTPMRDVDARAVRAWVQWMKREGGRDGSPLARSTIRAVYALMHKTCARAVQNGDMAANPCTPDILREDAPRPTTRAELDATKPNALDAEGIRRANALLDSTTNGRLRVGARLALACGLRSQEVCGLTWADVDPDGRTLDVRGAIGRAEGGTYDKAPKTPDSMRMIPVPEAVAAELGAWREAQRARWHALADGQEHAEGVPEFAATYVVGWPDGRFMTPHALGNAWSRLAEAGDECGPLVGTRGRRCTFHDLRHTYATHAIASGADVRSVAALMGHKDASVTLSIYADALPDAQRAAAELAAGVLTAGSSWAGAGSTYDPEAAALAFAVEDAERATEGSAHNG